MKKILAWSFVAVLLTCAGVAYATNPPSQIMYGAGQAITLTGATPAAPGASTGGGLIVDTVNTLTNGLLLDVRNNGVSKFSVDYAGAALTLSSGSSLAYTLARTPVAVGWTTPFTFTSPADTALTASTEFNDWLYTGATKSWLTGALTTERQIVINPNTFAFIAGSTVTNAATVDIVGGANAGSNATITNDSALRIETSNVAAGGGTVTNAFGLNVVAPTGAGTANVAATFNGPVGIAASSNFVPTSVLFTISDVAATTTPIANIAHATSVIGNSGALLKLASTSIDTGTTTGNLLDLSASASVAGTLASIRASNASQTSETALEVKQSGTTTGYTGNFVALTGSSTTGTGNLLSLTCVNTTNGACESITSNAVTSGTVLSIPHTTSAIINSGSLVALSSTSIDTGTTTGNLLDLSATASVAGTLASIRATNASQTTETALEVKQTTTGAGYTGNFVAFTGSSTTGAGNLLSLTAVNTTDGSAESITANSATTSTKGILALSGTGLTSGIGIKATGGGAAMLTGGILADVEMGAATVGTGVKVVTSGVYTDTAAAPLWVSATGATTSTFGIGRIDAQGLTTGSALAIRSAVPGTMTNAGSAIRVTDGTSDIFRVGVDGHVSGLQTTAPVVTSSGGSAATCTNGNNGAGLCTDSHGIMGYTTAVGTTAITLTFHTAYALPPTCVISAVGANTATDFAASKPAVSTTASTLVITPQANWAATAKTFSYICME